MPLENWVQDANVAPSPPPPPLLTCLVLREPGEGGGSQGNLQREYHGWLLPTNHGKMMNIG